MSQPLSQYQQLLKLVMEQGIRSESQMEVDTITLLSPMTLRYDLSKEVPVITERKISEKMWKVLSVNCLALSTELELKQNWKHLVVLGGNHG